MIGKLRGRVDTVEGGRLVLEVGGVGYLVEVPERIAGGLVTGAEATLHIETVVREDAIRLFGFVTAEEKAWFGLLQNVQGVGAKTALAILTALAVPEIVAAVASQDAAAIARAHGVGAKLAKRIASELKDKVPAMPIVVSAPVAGRKPLARADAISALINLGYPPGQATMAVDKGLARLGEKAPVEELIREGLRQLT